MNPARRLTRALKRLMPNPKADASPVRAREAVSSTHAHETIPRADEAILPAYENSRKHRPVISMPWSTMEFDHVARHHQPDLPPGLQALSGRSSKAAGVGLITVRW
jgi:hypothetical protein